MKRKTFSCIDLLIEGLDDEPAVDKIGLQQDELPSFLTNSTISLQFSINT